MAPIEGQIAGIILNYLANSITPAETAQLTAWINAKAEHKQLFDELTNEELVRSAIENLGSYDTEEGWKKLQQRLPELKDVSLTGKKTIFNWRRAISN